jgi:hypothetical protein
MQIEMRQEGGLLWLTPRGWVDPATPVRVVSLPVAGGQLAFDPASPRPALPVALITSLEQASWWIASVYGDDALQAALDGASEATAVPGSAALPLTQLAHAVWLQRWWHPAPGQQVDFDLLAAEIGTLQVEAAVCFEDDDLAEAELTAGLTAVLGLPDRIRDEIGPRRVQLDERLAALVDAASWYADREHPGYPHLEELAAAIAAEQALTDGFSSQLDAFLAEQTRSHRELALHAGGSVWFLDEESAATVDWLLVPERSTSGEEDDVLVGLADDQLVIQVSSGTDPVRELAALVYLDDDYPVRIIELRLDGAVYTGSTDWDPGAGVPDTVVITRVPLLDDASYAPRGEDVARADRDYVRRVVADRLASIDDTSLVSEVLAS